MTNSGGPAKPTHYVSYSFFAVGVPNALLCVEMIIISIVYTFAYLWKPCLAQPSCHKPITPSDEEVNGMGSSYADALVNQAGSMGWRAMVDVLNFSDIGIGFFRGCQWLVQTRHIKAEVVTLQRFDAEHNYGCQGSSEALERWDTNDLVEGLVAESQTRSRSNGR